MKTIKIMIYSDKGYEYMECKRNGQIYCIKEIKADYKYDGWRVAVKFHSSKDLQLNDVMRVCDQ